jgi:death-on-curing protein
MRYLTLEEVLELHHLVLTQSCGATGVRDLGALESAVAQPLMSFGGQDLYPALTDKAAAMAFSIIQNHPFIDGNKRVGHAGLETFFVLNGYELVASVDEQEQVILGVAAGRTNRAEFADWVRSVARQLRPD